MGEEEAIAAERNELERIYDKELRVSNAKKVIQAFEKEAFLGDSCEINQTNFQKIDNYQMKRYFGAHMVLLQYIQDNNQKNNNE